MVICLENLKYELVLKSFNFSATAEFIVVKRTFMLSTDLCQTKHSQSSAKFCLGFKSVKSKETNLL